MVRRSNNPANAESGNQIRLSTTDIDIRETIQGRLNTLGLSQSELARELETTRSSINQLLSGKNGKIPHALLDVLDYLDLELTVVKKEVFGRGVARNIWSRLRQFVHSHNLQDDDYINLKFKKYWEDPILWDPRTTLNRLETYDSFLQRFLSSGFLNLRWLIRGGRIPQAGDWHIDPYKIINTITFYNIVEGGDRVNDLIDIWEDEYIPLARKQLYFIIASESTQSVLTDPNNIQAVHLGVVLRTSYENRSPQTTAQFYGFRSLADLHDRTMARLLITSTRDSTAQIGIQISHEAFEAFNKGEILPIDLIGGNYTEKTWDVSSIAYGESEKYATEDNLMSDEAWHGVVPPSELELVRISRDPKLPKITENIIRFSADYMLGNIGFREEDKIRSSESILEEALSELSGNC